MMGLGNLVRRNVKLFFKDKGMFFSSLITPLILLVLYATFLAKVYRDSFNSALPEGFIIDDALLNATVGGQLVSSLLAVCCITVAFCSNLLMISDKANGTIRDLTVTPISRTVLALGYFIATAIATLIISFVALGACFVYLSFRGWYMTFADVAAVILDVFLLTMFGTALSSCINFPLSTNGQASAVGTVVSAGYGFICGAYMPISNFSDTLQKIMSLLPGTYGTSLIRNHMMAGAFREMADVGFPAEVVEGIKGSIDCKLEFFGHDVGIGAMYAVLAGSVILFVGVYVLMNTLKKKQK